MDLGKSITWAGIDLNSVTALPTGQPLSGYKVDRMSIEPPPLTEYIEKRALTDGLVAHDVYLGGRNITAIVTAYGTSAGDFWDKAQALHRVMSAPLRLQASIDASQEYAEGFGNLAFYQPTNSTAVGQWPTSAYPNGIPLAYNVRPESISYDLERSKDLPESDEGQAKAFRLNWIAKDAKKIHISPTTLTTSSTSGTATLAYRGDYPNYPIIQWTQTAAGAGSMSLFVDEVLVTVSISDITSVPAAVYFDYDTRSVTIGDPLDSASTNRDDIIGTIGGFPRVTNGSTFRAVSGTGIANSRLSMVVYEAFA